MKWYTKVDGSFVLAKEEGDREIILQVANMTDPEAALTHLWVDQAFSVVGGPEILKVEGETLVCVGVQYDEDGRPRWYKAYRPGKTWATDLRDAGLTTFKVVEWCEARQLKSVSKRQRAVGPTNSKKKAWQGTDLLNLYENVKHLTNLSRACRKNLQDRKHFSEDKRC